ncbi:MAG: hypothetical protein GQ470_00950 [Gammaproteobacteria bacterium]|nr:hypothetical protein [Gammaproteobacteria bacterium]
MSFLKSSQNKYSFYKIIIFASIFLSGCATYNQGVNDGLTRMETGDYKGSIAAFQKNLADDGNDRLLYHMELGLLHHLNGDYNKSNERLSQADKIAEKLFTTSVTGALVVGVSNPRNGPYRGTDFEKVFIHYYRSLNYLFLAGQSDKNRLNNLEASAIEVRKVDILLADIANQKGSYDELQNTKKGDFFKIKKIFSDLYSGFRMTDDFVYREDAYLRYLSGVIYEINGELDDARISYQKAAELYEKGVSKQYALGEGVIEQAWFDVIRLMLRIGGFDNRVSELSKNKLSMEKREELKDIGNDDVPVFIIQHLGKVQQKEEMNLHLTLHTRVKNMVIRPVLSGTREQKQDQLAWFTALYAGHGLLNVAYNYRSGKLLGVIDGVHSKIIPVAPVWGIIKSMRLDESLAGLGVRVTVPYYPPIKNNYSASTLSVDGAALGELVDASSISDLALQEQLLNANRELKEAMTRAIIKNHLAQKTANQMGLGGLSFLAGSLVSGATSAAETRSWLTLPERVRVKRLMLTPGRHTIEVMTRMKDSGKVKLYGQEIEVEKGKINIIKFRS